MEEPSKYDNISFKLKQFIQENKLDKKIEKYKLISIKSMVDELNMLSIQDVYQLAYLLWNLQNEFKILLNDGYLLNKINLNDFKNKILLSTPNIKYNGNAGLNPLGGPRCTFDGAIPYYDCIKFIGQFTNSQEVYDKCLEILDSMPPNIKHGWLLNPITVMYLMGYNENIINHKNNKHIEDNLNIDTEDLYYHFIYTPNPSQSEEYERYLTQVQKHCSILCLKKKNISSYLCLSDLLHIHNWNELNYNDFQVDIKDIFFKIKNLFIKINKIQIDNNIMIIQEEIDIKNKINNKLRFIRKSDESAIKSIFINAFIYVTDDKYDKEILKRNLLIELFERNFVEPNSFLSHYLLREAVMNGILWIVKFLISKGCRTKDLIKNKNLHEQHDDNRELKYFYEKFDILTMNDNKDMISKKNVFNYLIENNLI